MSKSPLSQKSDAYFGPDRAGPTQHASAGAARLLRQSSVYGRLKKAGPVVALDVCTLQTPGLELRFLFGQVRDDVLVATGWAVQPHTHGILGGSMIFLHQ